jgi:hypothetical protein
MSTPNRKAQAQGGKLDLIKLSYRWLVALNAAHNAMMDNFQQKNSTRWRFQNGALSKTICESFPDEESRVELYYVLANSPWGSEFGFARARERHLAELEHEPNIEAENPLTSLLEFLADWIEAEESWRFYIAYKQSPDVWRAEGIQRSRAVAASILANQPRHIKDLSPWGFYHLWDGGEWKGKSSPGLLAECALTHEGDWRAILATASKLRPASYGYLDVDEWMWNVFPIVKHWKWTATEAETVIRQRFGNNRVPGGRDKNGFAQHFRKIGLRFEGNRTREAIPFYDLALSL